MFQTRLWFLNNSPYNHYNQKISNELTYLHKELNYQQGKQFLRRLTLVFLALMTYQMFFFEEYSRDYRDKFDTKFNNKAYGSLDDSSGEGNTSIDD